jgi:hypothetical protein
VFGVLSIVFLAISLIFNLMNIVHGHIDFKTFAVAGLLCLAVHVTTGGWWGPLRRV